jgi:hypothetical protein
VSINQYPEWIKCNELNAIQSQEIIALKKRIKRLEEAGDVLCAAAAFMGWHMEIEKWNKAKEAKP